MHPVLYASLVLLSLAAGMIALVAGAAAYHVLAELTVFLSILCLGFSRTPHLDPVDRTARITAAAAVGMVAIRLVLAWQRSEPASVSGTGLATLARFALPAYLIVWTALVSVDRPPGQYLYNLVFVSSFGLLIGRLLAGLVSATPAAPEVGGLVSFLQGAAAGSAFGYVTLGTPGKRPAGGQEP